MGKKKKSEITKEIIDVLGYVRGDESTWGVAVAKMQWNDDPTTINIRNMHMEKDIMGSGVSISDHETELLTNILIRNDYGDINELKEAIRKRESFTDYGDIVNENEETFIFRIKYT